MKCDYKDCPGSYKEKLTDQVNRKNGKVVVITDVPSLVCNLCGDTFYSSDAALQLERLRYGDAMPVGSVPLYDYMLWSANESIKRNYPASSNGAHDEVLKLRCRLGNPGHYVEELKAHLRRRRSGERVVINNVPQLTCNFCADTLFDTRTLHLLDNLPDSDIAPVGIAEVYHFAQGVEQPAKELVANNN